MTPLHRLTVRTLALLAPLGWAVGCQDFDDAPLELNESLYEDFLASDRIDDYEMVQQGLDVTPGRSLCVNRGFTDEQILQVPEGGAPFFGTSGPDCILGTAGPDIIYGLGGDDVIFSGGGGDFVDGGAGNDQIWGGEGDDELRGGTGNDIIYGRGGNDRIYGGAGDDVIWGQAGNDRLFGQDGNDLLYGGDGDDYLNGGAGNDRVLGERGNDQVWSGEGPLDDDFLYGGPGNDIVVGGLNQSTRMAGQEGNDDLRGRGGNNLMIGGGTGNVISPGIGQSVIILDPTDRLNRPSSGAIYACNRPLQCELPQPTSQYFERIADVPPGFCAPGSEYTRPISSCIFCRNDIECDDGNADTLDYCLPSFGCVNELIP